MKNRYRGLNLRGGVVALGSTIDAVAPKVSGIALGMAAGGGWIVDRKLNRIAKVGTYPQHRYFWRSIGNPTDPRFEELLKTEIEGGIK